MLIDPGWANRRPGQSAAALLLHSGKTEFTISYNIYDIVKMIPRAAAKTLHRFARGFPVLALTGPRQSGKTTLARAAFPAKRYVSLENPDERLFATQDPKGFLGRFPDGAILDEAQHCPELFSYLQSLADGDGRMGLFVLTGSQNFQLLSGITQSLAGRSAVVQLLPFSLAELAAAGKSPGVSLDEFLLKGLYPPLYDRKLRAQEWYGSYLMTYLERDVRHIANVHDLILFQRFVRMCAARTGQLLNLSSLAADCGVSQGTARNWIAILQASYVLFLLQPHHENFGKRLVKTPKLYFHDTGLAAALLGIQDAEHMAVHPSRPALFETFVVNEFLKARFNAGLGSNLYFWRDNVGNEVDLVAEDGPVLKPVEIKSGKTLADESFAGLRRWLKVAGKRSAAPVLVYGGEESFERSGIAVRSWLAFGGAGHRKRTPQQRARQSAPRRRVSATAR
ncbi:MAG: ATP-binding protein [Burkholderiales bacterium]